MRDFIARLLVCLYRVVKIISVQCNAVSLQEFMPLRQARFHAHTAPPSREEKALNSFKNKNHTIHTQLQPEAHHRQPLPPSCCFKLMMIFHNTAHLSCRLFQCVCVCDQVLAQFKKVLLKKTNFSGNRAIFLVLTEYFGSLVNQADRISQVIFPRT